MRSDAIKASGNRLQFCVIDYNYENFIPRASRMVKDPFQTSVFDYNSFIIDYNYEKHNNKTDSELEARVLH